MCRRSHRVEDFAQAIRAVGEPIHARTADQISMAKLLTLLFEVTGLFDMTTRLELVMLQKTMVVVEGVARKLDPQLDMWATAEPVVGGWIAENLGPRGRLEDVGADAGADGRALLIDAAGAARAPGAPPRGGRRLARRGSRQNRRAAGLQSPLALWAIVGILLVIVYHFS